MRVSLIALFKVIRILYKSLILNKNKVDKKFTLLLANELKQYREAEELSASIKKVFPSGGTKIMHNYNKYCDSVQFGTRIKHLSHFYMDLKSLEQDGTLRQYISSINNLEIRIEEEINNRIEILKNSQKLKDGTIESDISKILDQKYKLYYLSLLDDDTKHNKTLEKNRLS